MSTLAVEIKKIVNITSHPNAERLELAQIEDWTCVVGKGNFKAGDLCCYFPVDSMLPEELEAKLFPPGSKVTLKNGRIKPIRIRQVFSQGLAVPVSTVTDKKAKEGEDLTIELGVKKYTPPPPPANLRGGHQVKKRLINENFHKYTDIERVHKHLNWFKNDEIVVAREKIHGTNYRVGWVKNEPNTLWKKVLKFVGYFPEFEFCFGSRNLQLTSKETLSIVNNNPFVPKNAYEQITKEHKFKEKLKLPGRSIVVYGEIYGPNVQKGYHYGLKEGQLGFVCFDVEVDGKFLSDNELELYCGTFYIPLSPKLYEGPFDLAKLTELTKGNSVMAPTQKVMEGLVVRPVIENNDVRGRKIAKIISEEYALGENTEFQ